MAIQTWNVKGTIFTFKSKIIIVRKKPGLPYRKVCPKIAVYRPSHNQRFMVNLLHDDFAPLLNSSTRHSVFFAYSCVKSANSRSVTEAELCWQLILHFWLFNVHSLCDSVGQLCCNFSIPWFEISKKNDYHTRFLPSVGTPSMSERPWYSYCIFYMY